MKNIEKILKNVNYQHVKIPLAIKNRINFTLQNKKCNQGGINMKKLVASFASLMLVLVGGISVYASFGGTISGKPVVDWLGIKFSDQYQNYVIPSKEEQKVVNEETEISLVSTMCNEGFTVLEFNVHLSEKDKQYLRLDQNILTEDEITKIEQETKKDLSYLRNAKNSLSLFFNSDEYDHNYNLIIDHENYWIRPRTAQQVSKISDYEYKIYQLYFLTDQELKGKTDFTLTLDNVVLTNGLIPTKELANSHKSILTNTADNEKSIKLEGTFTIPLSKTESLENTKIIPGDQQEATYKNMVKRVDKIILTPMQTIVKIDSIIDNVSLTSLIDTNSKDYIGLSDYKVQDDQGNDLSSISYEINQKITYTNGKVEELDPEDMANLKDFKNAKLQRTEYIVIEKTDETKNIKITPFIQELGGKNEKYSTLNEFKINLLK